jgi:hypothetical protein
MGSFAWICEQAGSIARSMDKGGNLSFRRQDGRVNAVVLPATATAPRGPHQRGWSGGHLMADTQSLANQSLVGKLASAVRNPSSSEASMEERRRITRIKRVIRRHTSGGIRELAVELGAGSVHLRGQCNSFYCKQMAQQAAMNFLPGETIVNEIEVAGLPR